VTFRSVIAGTGSSLPKRRVDNEELAQKVDTSDQWIVERTGIRSRYIAGEGETTASLATDAARRALDDAKLEASEVDLIVLATATPFPRRQRKSRRRLGSAIASLSTCTPCAPAFSMQ
jgi:3-oxoacyl-[acyl-carrier-protein] synthase-3